MDIDRCEPTADGRCTLCSDAAFPMRVRSVTAGDATAIVDAEDGERMVAIDLVDDVMPGDTLLVHQGFAIARLAAREK